MEKYDLHSLTLPVLKGTLIKVFANLLNFQFTRNLLLPNLLKQGGIIHFRTLNPKEDPTLYPLVSDTHKATQPHQVDFVEEMVKPSSSKAPYRAIQEFSSAYKNKSITPLQIAEIILSAIQKSESMEPPMRIFIDVNHEDILEQARLSTERYQSGHPLSIFDGVPIIIKDELNQHPYPSNIGTSFLGNGAVEDCTPVKRLRQAGALLLGKANMNELGLDPSGFNQHFGTTRNPYNPQFDPGGSSGGPAAGVSAGFAPVAIGCDGGGSIRIPASFCGVVGLKPTFGRVSEWNVVPLCPSVDSIGPIGCCAEDVALTLGVIAGPDLKDPRSQYQPPLNLEGWNDPDLHGVKIGIYPPWFEHATAKVVSVNKSMLNHFQYSGAEIINIEVEDLDAMRVAHVISILGEQAAHMQNYAQFYKNLSAPTQITLSLSKGFSSVDYIQAQRIRTRAMEIFKRCFEQVDAILTPATAITAPRIPENSTKDGWSDLSTTTEKMRYAFPANLTGLPAISFPVGYDSQGLPVGMQAMSYYWNEKLLLRLAYVAEQAIQRIQPKVFFNLLP
jgi:Asp-tRNA(Asn)/Glu-tRNA(Gln) amidotransferase A subunit family amidase